MIIASIVMLLPCVAFFGYRVWRVRHRVPWRDIGIIVLWFAFVALFGWFASGVVLH
jgi:hypothetical protein